MKSDYVVCYRIGVDKFQPFDLSGVIESNSCKKALNKFLIHIKAHSSFRYFKIIKEKDFSKADFVVYRKATMEGYQVGFRLDVNPKYKFHLSKFVEDIPQ